MPVALLAPGASYGPAKCWPAASFARVGDALVEAGAQVLVVGAPGEVDRCGEVVAQMSSPAIDLAGRAELGVLKAIVRQASVLVCNDAGARHVAVAFGVPTVALFGPTSLAKTDLNLDGVRVIEGEAHCRPCYLRECPIDHRCLVGIEADRVAAAALEALAEGRARHPAGPTPDGLA